VGPSKQAGEPDGARAPLHSLASVQNVSDRLHRRSASSRRSPGQQSGRVGGSGDHAGCL